MGPALAEFIHDGPSAAAWTVVLAHGAGQGMRSAFMEAFAGGLVARGDEVGGVRCVRFEFPYMIQNRASTAGRRPPDREAVLLACWRDTVAALAPDPQGRRRLVIGGKSMGGRMASLVADELAVAGLLCLGYPFHPAGKPRQLRTDHLQTLVTPTLICQGERDPLGTRDEVAQYPLSKAIDLHWLPAGDHGYRPPKSAPHSEVDNWNRAMTAVLHFLRRLEHLEAVPRPRRSRRNGVEVKRSRSDSPGGP
ncbi:MAG: alpha/beta family hydrolase [Candidatus Competibacterales bacterium]